MQIYSKNNKNCFFLISWPIFILFVLSDRWGLQNLYTKFQNSLIMQIYATIFMQIYSKSQKMPVLHLSTDFYFVCFIW